MKIGIEIETWLLGGRSYRFPQRPRVVNSETAAINITRVTTVNVNVN